MALNNVLDQMDLNDIQRAFHPKEATYTFFSNAHKTFSKIDHMIRHKRSLNKLKKTEITSSISSDHKGLKLETNLKENTPKHLNAWRLNNMLLHNEQVKNEIREEIKKFLETNENELTIIRNLWDTATAVLTGKFIAIQAYLKRIETSQINNLTLCLQELEEQQQRQPKANRRKEITKIRAELNDIETKNTIARINESRSWFFEKINKIDKPLSRLIKKKRERVQINRIRNERGEITTDTTEIQRIVRNYYEELYTKNFENLGEMDTFLEKYNLPKLNEEEAENMNRPITADKTETVIKKLPTHKSPGLDVFTGEFYKAFKEELTPILHRLFKKIQTDG